MTGLPCWPLPVRFLSSYQGRAVLTHCINRSRLLPHQVSVRAWTHRKAQSLCDDGVFFPTHCTLCSRKTTLKSVSFCDPTESAECKKSLAALHSPALSSPLCFRHWSNFWRFYKPYLLVRQSTWARYRCCSCSNYYDYHYPQCLPASLLSSAASWSSARGRQGCGHWLAWWTESMSGDASWAQCRLTLLKQSLLSPMWTIACFTSLIQTLLPWWRARSASVAWLSLRLLYSPWTVPSGRVSALLGESKSLCLRCAVATQTQRGVGNDVIMEVYSTVRGGSGLWSWWSCGRVREGCCFKIAASF